MDVPDYMSNQKFMEDSLKCDNNANRYKPFEVEFVTGFRQYMFIGEIFSSANLSLHL